ncbi:MAG: hypothetical protein U5L45_19680 [Saprospiraceae bacterium]|nr:hypothetical protein [Saprospiraceae bacterium]
MLTLFRTNQPLANILLLFYLGILRASSFIHPATVAPPPQGILTAWMYADVSPLSMVAHIFAFLLVFFQATTINIAIARYRVASELSLLPGLFYCLFCSLMPDFLVLSSVLLANTFVILSIFYLFDTYKNSYVAGRIFDAGLWLGVASLFYFPYILFVIWGIVGLGILRGLRGKEFLMFSIGYIVPFFLMSVFCFWHGILPQIGNHFLNNISMFNFVPYNSQTLYVKIGVIALIILLVLGASAQFFSRRNMTAQKYLSILYWLILFGGLSITFQTGIGLVHFLVLSVPVSILLSMVFQRINSATSEVLHMLFLVVALILQFEYLLIT